MCNAESAAAAVFAHCRAPKIVRVRRVRGRRGDPRTVKYTLQRPVSQSESLEHAPPSTAWAWAAGAIAASTSTAAPSAARPRMAGAMSWCVGVLVQPRRGPVLKV